MARVATGIKVQILTVAKAESKSGKEFYQIIARHNGETLVIGASIDTLPMAPEAMANREMMLPVTVKADRMDLWLARPEGESPKK